MQVDNPISTAMKEQAGMRITLDHKWMIYDKDVNEWQVFHKKKYAKRPTLIVRSINLESAVYNLINY